MCRSLGGIGLIIALLFAAATGAAPQYAFQVTFTDKNNTPYSLSNPSVYLSPRALSRRAAQGIIIDSTDLPVNHAYVDSVLTLTGGKFHETSRWLNMCVILLPDSALIHAIDGKPYIRNIKLVGIYSPDLHKTSNNTVLPTTPAARKTTGFNAAYYGNTWSQTTLVNGDYLHSRGYNGSGKLIAVLDAGFIGSRAGAGFDSLWRSGRVADTFDFTYANKNVFTQEGHGTEVLSNMAGYVPGTYVGSAPGAMYALYLTEYQPGDQPLELDNLLSATERADSIGADIVTISLGYDVWDNFPGQNFSTDLDGKTTVGAMAANIATKKGMLFVATAGNDGAPPIAGWGTHILTPGDADSALTIGAADATGNVYYISGYGPNAAGQIKPDVCGMGASAAIINSSGVFTTGDGTSYATPQIAGWAACLWQANPSATPYQLRQAIIGCASNYNNPSAQAGYGVPNLKCAQEALAVLKVPSLTVADWIAAMPNPFANEINLVINAKTGENINFTITDVTGRTIASYDGYFYGGTNKPFTIVVPPVAAGIYLLKAASATQQKVIKLEKH